MISNKQLKYIKKEKRKKIFILLSQISIGIFIILLWEILAKFNLINTFITSSPSKIIINIYNMIINGSLFKHIWVTLNETLIAFFLTFIISLIISLLIYKSPIFSKIIDPYLTILNSLPKVALGPILIIWLGSGKQSIITMSILISIIVSIQSISVGFINTDKDKIKILKIFGSNELQIIKYVLIPSNIKIILNTCKINIGLCLIGVIMGEFLTSKAGIGYLILYGSQIFNLTLVMSGIIVLLFMSILLYEVINILEKHLEF